MNGRVTPPHIPCRRGRQRSQDGHHLEPHRIPTYASWAREPRTDPHDPSGQLGTPGSAGALAGPSLHSGRPLLTGSTAGHAIRASPPRVALGGPPVHSSVVHPPISTAQLSTRATRPHIPCRHLQAGNTARLAHRASPARVALDGPLLHASVVHPPRLTAQVSTHATRPHIPCRRGRQRSQKGHHREPRSVPAFAPSGLGATQEPTRSVRANRHPRKDTTTNHVPSRRSPHRAWGPSKNPQDPSGQLSTPGSAPRKDTTTNHVASRLPPHRAWGTSKNPHDPSGQIGTPGSAGALAGPSLHSGQPLPSGNTAKLSTRATTEPQTTAGRNPDKWHHHGTHTDVADARALLHRLRLISTDSRASHSEGKPS